MHDFYLANQIVKLILEQAKKNRLKKVSKILIEFGKIVEHGEEIKPENLEFNIKLLAKGTLAEGAEVVIRRVRGKAWELRWIEGG